MSGCLGRPVLSALESCDSVHDRRLERIHGRLRGGQPAGDSGSVRGQGLHRRLAFPRQHAVAPEPAQRLPRRGPARAARVLKGVHRLPESDVRTQMTWSPRTAMHTL